MCFGEGFGTVSSRAGSWKLCEGGYSICSRWPSMTCLCSHADATISLEEMAWIGRICFAFFLVYKDGDLEG